MFKKHPLQSIIPTVKIGDDGEVSEIKSEKDKFENQVLTQYSLYAQISEHFLLEIFDKLPNINAQELTTFIQKKLPLTEDLKSVINDGIKEYFDSNYKNSIIKLVPNIESIIRQILRNKGIEPTVRQRDNSIRLKTFGQLLSDPDVKTIFGEDFLVYLKIKYVDPDFQNIRNKIAHGLIKNEEYTKNLSLSIIFTILKLCGV